MSKLGSLLTLDEYNCIFHSVYSSYFVIGFRIHGLIVIGIISLAFTFVYNNNHNFQYIIDL